VVLSGHKEALCDVQNTTKKLKKGHTYIYIVLNDEKANFKATQRKYFYSVDEFFV
jgi:hypothetical protein